MINAIITCSGGCSSAVFAEKMNEYSRKNGIELQVRALKRATVSEDLDQVDVLLLAPQVSYLKRKFEKQYPDAKFKMISIAPLDFGQCNVEKIAGQILQQVQQN